jgi:uncharacterized membrane protein YhaH (DUF805 family)
MKWYLQALKNYAVFRGRARRREYWLFEWGNVLIFMALIVTGRLVHARHVGLLPSLYIAAIVIPSLSSLVRRLHDTNRSGWWFFITLVPVIGPLMIASFTLTDSNPGENRFGPNPKIETSGEAPTMGYLVPPLPPQGR